MNTESFHPAAGAATLPREIASERMADGVRYRLPARQLGPIRFLGLVPAVFGLCFMIIPLVFFRDLWRNTSSHFTPVHGIIFLLLLIFFLPALKAISFGMLLLAGRCTVELKGDWLRAIDSAGPFRNVRKARIADVRRFQVNVGDRKPLPQLLQPLQGMGGLDAEFDEAKPMPVALGYPREWMVALGNELSRHITEVNVTRAQPALPATAEVVKTLPSRQPDPAAFADVLLQPAASTARLEDTPAALTLVLPARGFRRGSKGMLSFGIMWCLFMLVFTAVPVLASGKSHAPMLVFIPFIGLFWIIGLTFIVAAINSARRRALVIATATELRIAQESPFRKKTWAWSRDQISAVCADRSGLEVNNKPVMELQVHSIDGKKTGLFRERDDAELQWIATVLRHKLALAGG